MMTEANSGYAQESYVHESRKRPLENQDDGRDAKRHWKTLNNTKPLLKLMVPNYAAGALIGKGGALLKELKETYGGFVRLSSGREYYPGTEERIVVITGEINQIVDINNHVMEKVQDPGRDITLKNVAIDGDRAKKIKIILTNGSAGLLIGRGGATIKAIQESTKAKISITMPDKATVPGERVATISGSLDERTEACRQVIEKIAADESNIANTKTKYESANTDMYTGHGANTGYSSGGAGYEGRSSSFSNRQQESGNQYSGNGMSSFQGLSSSFNNRQQQDSGNQYSGNGMSSYQGLSSSFNSGQQDSGNQYSGNGMSSYQGGNDTSNHSYQSAPRKLPAKVQVDIQVPNAMVGAVLGKQGSIIKDFVQRSGGARFKFHDKSDDADRTLTITGNMDQIQIAYNLLNERVEQIRNQPNTQGF